MERVWLSVHNVKNTIESGPTLESAIALITAAAPTPTPIPPYICLQKMSKANGIHEGNLPFWIGEEEELTSKEEKEASCNTVELRRW